MWNRAVRQRSSTQNVIELLITIENYALWRYLYTVLYILLTIAHNNWSGFAGVWQSSGLLPIHAQGGEKVRPLTNVRLIIGDCTARGVVSWNREFYWLNFKIFNLYVIW